MEDKKEQLGGGKFMVGHDFGDGADVVSFGNRMVSGGIPICVRYIMGVVGVGDGGC